MVGVLGVSMLGLAQNTSRDAPSDNAVGTASSQVVNTPAHKNRVAPTEMNDGQYELSPGTDPQNELGLPLVKHLAMDQGAFWMAPAHFHVKDLEWIAPFAGTTAAFVAGDSWLSKQIPLGEVDRSKKFSNYATYSLIGAGAGSYVLGNLTNNDQLSEAGFLSGEAAINSTAIAYLLKSMTERPRPFQENGGGAFFKGGMSFPSEHSAIAWSVASVIAHEYPGTFTKILAYGLATGISATRVTGQQHFSSDVIVGSALGWYFGRQVYRSHHDTTLGGAGWGDIVPQSSGEKNRNPENMGSPYVPIDSWIYPAFDRLIALGYVKNGFLGIRPWTRMECARLLEEAEERLGDEDDQSTEAARIHYSLSEEFASEVSRLSGAPNVSASIDSVYARATGISGTPLRDGFHFGQTIINDYGRPYGEGFNSADGMTAHAEAGPLSIFLQGEYQHAPAVASDAPSILQATAAVDSTLPLPNGLPVIDRFRLLEGTVAVTLRDVQVSFGQQSLWLGPTESGPFLFSDNAEPMAMLRIDSVSPYEIPLISRVLGPVKSEFFLGQFSGQHWEFSPVLYGPNLASQPFVHGTKFSFHPTSNLEFGLGFTAQFGGPGNPFTWHNFLRTFYSHKVGVGNNPAKRLSEFSFTYRVPGLRDWLQIYADSMVIDEYSPLISNRPAINPGIYFCRVPKLPKLDLRLEGVTTDMNVPGHFGPGAFYWDGRYHSGYTNNGDLVGSWIGRRGRGEIGWLTYHFSPETDLQLSYRHNDVDPAFLEGGKLQDLTLKTDVMLGKKWEISGWVQHENWHFPILSPSAQSDFTASVQMTYFPHWTLSRSH